LSGAPLQTLHFRKGKEEKEGERVKRREERRYDEQQATGQVKEKREVERDRQTRWRKRGIIDGIRGQEYRFGGRENIVHSGNQS